jgi:predicted RND superfamily exporter protein
MIKQISIFSIISLSVAYIHFAFIYPHLKIKHVEPYNKENTKIPFSVKGYKIILFSIIIMILAIFNTKFDFNIKNLDYQNEKLISLEQFFKERLHQSKKLSVLITGSSIDRLIENSKLIKNIDYEATIPTASLLSQNQYIKKYFTIESFDFPKLKNDLINKSKDIGFKNEYFSQSYKKEDLYPKYPQYSLNMVKSLGFDIVEEDNKFVTYAMISPSKIDEVLKHDFVINTQAKVLFTNSIEKVYSQFAIFGALTLILIISTLVLVTKKRFLQAFSYILFPMSLIMIYGFFIPLNIMHVFMTFIILAISIDYGIYMNESTLSHNTTIAIIYSLVSTFAGFGVLIISSINALFSIAITAIIGISGILFLLLFQKRIKKNK